MCLNVIKMITENTTSNAAVKWTISGFLQLSGTKFRSHNIFGGKLHFLHSCTILCPYAFMLHHASVLTGLTVIPTDVKCIERLWALHLKSPSQGYGLRTWFAVITIFLWTLPGYIHVCVTCRRKHVSELDLERRLHLMFFSHNQCGQDSKTQFKKSSIFHLISLFLMQSQRHILSFCTGRLVINWNLKFSIGTTQTINK